MPDDKISMGFLTIPALAERLDLPESGLELSIAWGHLPCIVMGGTRVVDVCAADAWFQRVFRAELRFGGQCGESDD